MEQLKFIAEYYNKHKAVGVSIACLLIFAVGITSVIFWSETKLNHHPFSLFLHLNQAAIASEEKEESSLDKVHNNVLQNTGSASGAVIFYGSRDKKQIALTFDAEMTEGMRANYLSTRVKSSYDKRIVDILTQTQTKATFFLTGMWMELFPKVTKELANNSLFELGSHSYTDSSFSGYCYGLKQLTDSQEIEQVMKTEAFLKMYTGRENHLFRFPGGCYSQKNLDMLKKQTQDTVIQWDVVGTDGFTQNTALIIDNVVSKVQNGSIIILHLNGAPTAPKTADALITIITNLKAQGFRFVTISELLNSSN